MKQRNYMRHLFARYGDSEETLVRKYADAERRGFVNRNSDIHELTAEQYARALFKDGMRKGWIKERSRERWVG